MLRWVALILLLLLIGLQMKLWSGHGGMRDVQNLRNQVQAQQDKNAKQVQINQALAADVADLKSGSQAIEARARSELGLVKPGEVFYQVIAKPANGASAPAPASTAPNP